MHKSARHWKFYLFMFILREKYLVLWEIASLAADRRLQVVCKCAKLKYSLGSHMQTLTTGLICESAGWLVTITCFSRC